MSLRRIACLVAFQTVAVFAQQSQPGKKLGVRVQVIPQPPSNANTQKPIPTRGPNDRVWINSDGDLIAEGATLPDGKPVTVRIIRQTHIQPSLAVSVRADGSRFEYRYRLTNGPSAKQWIQIFWLDLHGPLQTQPVVPTGWHVYRIDSDKPSVQRIWIGCSANGCLVPGQLSAGKTAGDFILRSDWRPGLIRVTAIGHKPLPGESGYLADDVELFAAARMSDGLRDEINAHLSTENNSVSVYTIGPKYSPFASPINMVRDELVRASRMREFGADRKALLELTEANDPAIIRARIQELARKASGLPAEFYGNLLTYLP